LFPGLPDAAKGCPRVTSASRIVFVLLLLVLLIGVGLRVWGIDFGLPYLYHPDEPPKIDSALNIVKTGDLNPHYFLSASLFIYLSALAYVPYHALGKLLGVFQGRGDLVRPTMLAMGVGRTPWPTSVLVGRLLTMLFGAGSIVLVYLVGSRMTRNRWVGLIAAGMMAVSPPAVANSRFITPDAFVTFFILLTTLGALRIYEPGRLADYVLAGVAAGLTVSCKYTGGLVLLLIPLAHFLRGGRAGLRDARLYLALLLCLVAFLVTSPFAVLDSREFFGGMLFEALHYSSIGHPGMENNAFGWYVSYLWRTEGLVALLAVGGMVYGLYKRSREILIVAAFLLLYFVFISLMTVRNDRTLLPAVPYLFVFASYGLAALFQGIRAVRARPLRIPGGALLAAVLVLLLLFPLAGTVRATQKLTTPDSRETARAWIAANLPAGSKIALESYAPFVDPERFKVQGFLRMIDQPPDWYATNHFDYLVFSQGMFGRFRDNSDLYPAEAAQYESFFDRFALLKTFEDGGLEVRIHRVTDSGPVGRTESP
jgi:4-amino-4-deoxy-L-arabinose transferase-like glycosyltransferase